MYPEPLLGQKCLPMGKGASSVLFGVQNVVRTAPLGRCSKVVLVAAMLDKDLPAGSMNHRDTGHLFIRNDFT